MKKRLIILCTICIIIIPLAVILDKYNSKTYFEEITTNNLIKKIENKEDIILCITRTTCSHCVDYKPKLEKIAKEYKQEIYFIEIDLLKEEEIKSLEKYISIGDNFSTPTTIFIKKGEEKTTAKRLIGDVSESKVIEKLKSNGFIK